MNSTANFRRRRLLRSMAAIGGAVATGTFPRIVGAQAQFPSKPIHLIVPYAPGGSTDAMARLIAKTLGERVGQSVLVENKPGASAAIGISAVAKAEPDGYTLLLTNESVVLNPLLGNAPVTPLNQLQPIAQVVGLPVSLYVNTAWGVRSLPEFLAKVKATPGKFNHGTGGPATRVISETFKAIAGFDYAEVSYRGLGPTMLALAAGDVHFVFSDPASAAPHVASGRITQIGVASAQRSSAQDGVPSISDSVKGFSVRSFGGVFAPLGTPRPIVDSLNAHIRAVIADADIVSRFSSLGIVPVSGSPEALGELARGLSEEMDRIIRERNIKIT